MQIPFVDLKAQYQHIKPEINQRIQSVLEHGQFIMGPEVAELEEALANYSGARNAIGLSSGSDALLVPLLANGIGAGHAVFLPSFTFTATAEMILLAGATPVFIDVDEDTFNLDPADLQRKIESVAAAGRLEAKAVIAVDLFGLPADYDAIGAIAAQNDGKAIDFLTMTFRKLLAWSQIGRVHRRLRATADDRRRLWEMAEIWVRW